jgi:hypothetical protein
VIKSRHSSNRALPNQIEIGKVLRQVASHRTEDPIQVAVPLNFCSLVTEVPHMLSPGLQLDEAQVRSRPNMDLAAWVKRLTFCFCMRGCLARKSEMRLFQKHQDVRKAPNSPTGAVQQLIYLDTAGRKPDTIFLPRQ